MYLVTMLLQSMYGVCYGYGNSAPSLSITRWCVPNYWSLPIILVFLYQTLQWGFDAAIFARKQPTGGIW